MTETRLIENTREPMRHPWPDDMDVQGGDRGVVFRRDDTPYRTAFVEAFPPNTFLRGEGATIAEAEDSCWVQYQRMQACPAAPDHGPFEARQYTNGAGFCTGCGGWFSRVLPPQPEVPGRQLSLMERVLSGDVAAATEALAIMADVDSLPTSRDDALTAALDGIQPAGQNGQIQ